jgi:hypothetical protein
MELLRLDRHCQTKPVRANSGLPMKARAVIETERLL